MRIPYADQYVSLIVNALDDSDDITITGRVTGLESELSLVAPAPVNHMANYSGSALPWPSAQVAFDTTPNRVSVNNEFTVHFKYPNSFYADGGVQKVVSSIFLMTKNNKILSTVELPDRFPLKTQTYRDVNLVEGTWGPYPERTKGPAFYNREAVFPIPLTQYEQLINIGYGKTQFNVA